MPYPPWYTTVQPLLEAAVLSQLETMAAFAAAQPSKAIATVYNLENNLRIYFVLLTSSFYIANNVPFAYIFYNQ